MVTYVLFTEHGTELVLETNLSQGSSPAGSRRLYPRLRKKHETLCEPAYKATRGSRLPIPSEPALRHRPWITPQGGPRQSEYNLNTHPEAFNIKHDFNRSIRTLQTNATAR